MKEVIRAGLSASIVWSGATRLGRRLRRNDGTLVLYGHRVADDDEGYLQGLPARYLRDQLEYLTKHFEVISLETLVACIEAHEPPPPRSVVLTFDDGFRDNVETAIPILDAYGVRATIFVVTRSLDTGELPWSQRLGYLFQHTDRSTFEPAGLGLARLSLSTERERREAYIAVKAVLAPLARIDRDRRIGALARHLQVEPPTDRMMTWDHAKEALAGGHTIGAHTYSHALLARVPLGEARVEMERARDGVASNLAIAHQMFCFPAGSVNRELVDLARDVGFRSAFWPDRAKRLNRAGSDDTFAIARVGMPNASALELEAELDGPFHAVRLLTGRYS